MMKKFKIIQTLYPNVITMYDDDAFDADGNRVEIDMDLVSAWVDPDAYKSQRAAAYPSFADQFDILYHGGYEAWRAAIESVKNQFPKPQ